MIYSLDTNAMIDVVNGRLPEVTGNYDDAVAKGAQIVTSSIAAHKFIYGALISARPVVQRRMVEALLDDLEVVDWSLDDALTTAQLRRDMIDWRRPAPVPLKDFR